MGADKNLGFTLIEVMITLAIIGVLSAIAIPSYNGYVKTTCQSTAGMNLKTLMSFEEMYAFERDTYVAGTHAAGTNSTLMDALDWEPDDKGLFNYEVTAGSTGNIADSISITVTGVESCADIPPVVDGN